MNNGKQERDIGSQYQRIIERAVDSLKQDQGVLMVLAFGGTDPNPAIEKSDTSLVAIVRDDKDPEAAYYIDESGVVIHLEIYPRTLFTRAIKRMNTPQLGGCGDNLPLAPGGCVMYCADDGLQGIFDEINHIGRMDIENALLPRACDMLCFLKKAEISVYANIHQAKMYLLDAVKCMAEMELILNGEAPQKEPLLQALAVSPALMQRFWIAPMEHSLAPDAVLQRIEEAYSYIDQHQNIICKRLLRYMAGDEPKRVSDLTIHFRTNIIHITEYLRLKGVLHKVSVPVPVTAGGRYAVHEIAYLYEG